MIQQQEAVFEAPAATLKNWANVLNVPGVLPETKTNVIGVSMGDKTGNCDGIYQLPAEIIEYILSAPCLDHHDICNVTKTCVFLRDICNSHELWKTKLQQRLELD